MTPEKFAQRCEEQKRAEERHIHMPEVEEFDPVDKFSLPDTRQLRCRWCGTTRLEVGLGIYYTMVRCPDCGTEQYLDEG